MSRMERAGEVIRLARGVYQMAGGYARNIDDTVTAHFNTVLAAAEAATPTVANAENPPS